MTQKELNRHYSIVHKYKLYGDEGLCLWCNKYVSGAYAWAYAGLCYYCRLKMKERLKSNPRSGWIPPYWLRVLEMELEMELNAR